MGKSTFSGPVESLNGFIGGTSASPVSVTAAGNVSSSYASSSATDGDTRLVYDKLTFTAAGSGETSRAFTVVSAAGAAPAGTVNGSHISLEIDTAGTISGAGNALRATLGGTATSPGGTLAIIQADTNFASGVTLPASASVIRISDSGAGANKIGNLLNIESASAGFLATGGTIGGTLKAIKIRVGSTTYYIPAGTTVTP